ncbi:MAG: RNA-guided endonuclease InsQ/TnpB family protein [Aggregatilineales bacterium]
MRNHIIALQKRYYRIYGKHVPSGQMQAHIGKLRMGKQQAHKPAGRKAKNYGKLLTYWQAIPSQSAPDMVMRVEQGYRNFFENLRKGKLRKVGLPRFKKSKKYSSPQFYREGMKQIQRLSRTHSRKVKGSNNRERSRLALARAHRDIANKRDNHHWHLAHALCKQYDVMVFETLNIKAMQQMWGRKISDLSFADFLEKLVHVANKLDKTIIQINRWEATSKTCSGCGVKKDALSLKERVFECNRCGLVLDRDHNAARNIYQVGTSTCRREVVRQDESDESSRSFV